MTKTEFKSFISYLKTHPSDAEILKAELDKIKPETGEQAQEGTALWLTAKEAGERLGRSAQWVKLHAYKLPDHCKMRKGSKRTLFVNFMQVQNQLEQIKQQ